MSKGRLEAFSHGVFGVAITLLILDIRPEGAPAFFIFPNPFLDRHIRHAMEAIRTPEEKDEDD